MSLCSARDTVCFSALTFQSLKALIRLGDSLYIPFYSTDTARESFGFYRQKTADRRANRELSAANPSKLMEKDLAKLPNVTVMDFWNRYWHGIEKED